MAGGYTPTIIARNQFVAVSNPKASKALGNSLSASRPSASVNKVDAVAPTGETASFPQHHTTISLNETVKLETS